MIGQVHLSGWFVAIGLALGTALFEWRGVLPRSRYWHWWLLGTILGLVSAFPWARGLPRVPLSLPAESLAQLLGIRVGSCCYALAASATSVLPFAALGLGENTTQYEVGPIIDGIRTRVPETLSWFITLLIAVRLVVLFYSGVVAPAVRWILGKIASRGGSHVVAVAPAPDHPPHAEESRASTGFYLWSTIAMPSAIFVLTTAVFFYHYFFVMCPFLFVLFAIFMLPWRRALLALVVAQALLSFCYLSYIHQKGGASHGEYGGTYARWMSQQMR